MFTTGPRPMKFPLRIISLVVLVCTAFWIVDALTDAVHYRALGLDFADIVYRDIPPHELLERLVLLGVAGIFTGLLAHLYYRQKQDRRVVEQSERQYRSIFQNNLSVILMIDPDTGAIVDANDSACLYYGYDRETFLTMRIQQINVLSPAQIRAKMQQARSQKANCFLFPHRLANGDIRHVEVYSGPVSIRGKDILISIIHDVTQRVEAEEALRHNQKRLLLAENIAHLGYWEWDIREDRVLWSSEAANIFGVGTEETSLPHSAYLERIHPDDRQAVLDAGQAAMEHNTKIQTEYRILLPGQIVRHVAVRGEILQDAAGAPMRLVGTVMDVTDRKQNEQRILDYQKRLKNLASELSTAEERQRRHFAEVLHDGINQTLFAAKMNLGLLGRTPEPEARGELIAETLRLLDDTMSDARNMAFELCPPILHEIGLEEALKWLAQHFEETYSLPCRYDGNIGLVPLEHETRDLLFQATQELLFNVVKHARAEQAMIEVSRRGDTLRIRVEDDGVGFDCHQELEPNPNMTGFGLFHLRERLASIGGAMRCQSEPGRGSSIRLDVPLPTTPQGADHEHSHCTGGRS